MEFRIQILLAVVVTCVISIPIILYKYKQYNKEGISTKYLEFKITFVVAVIVMSVPVLLSDMSSEWKLLAIILGLLAGILYAYSVTSVRRTFRKIMGYPPDADNEAE